QHHPLYQQAQMTNNVNLNRLNHSIHQHESCSTSANTTRRRFFLARFLAIFCCHITPLYFLLPKEKTSILTQGTVKTFCYR
ncbi:hypothetical protein JYU18_01340, partial [bacterium AH-315-E07]|nr:hypothetical protein [bacterium AH-315-E07]